MGKASRKKEDQTTTPSPFPYPVPTSSPEIGFLPLRLRYILLILAIITTITYSNTFHASFQFDDSSNIIENLKIRKISNFFDLSGARSIGYLSFALNYYFGKLDVFGYHLVNLIIHITNGFLVYSLVLLLIRSATWSHDIDTRIDRGSSSPSNKGDDLQSTLTDSPLMTASWIAWITALLFAVHPIQTQAVTYIVQRFTSLATLFYLVTIVSYLKWRIAGSTRQKSRFIWYGLALLATAFAMKTKEISFTLPFMILLIEMVFFRPIVKKQWAFLTPFILTLLIIPLSHPEVMGEAEAGFAKQTMSISRQDYLFTQFRVIMTYLRLLLIPNHQNLDYDFPIFHSFFHPVVFSSFLFLSCLFALGVFLSFTPRWISVREDPYPRLIGFGFLWFFLALSVESSFIPISDVIFEHRLYLPSIGFFMSITMIGHRVFLILPPRTKIDGQFSGPSLRTLINLSVPMILLSLAVLTYQRNLVWQSRITLWNDVVTKSYNKARPHNALGFAYADQGQMEEAIEEYNLAIEIQPNYTLAYNNLGIAYKALGRTEDSLMAYNKAISLQPASVKPHYKAKPHYNLGIAYKDLEQYDEAEKEFRAALDLKKDFPEAHFNLGLVYEKTGRMKEAVSEYQTGLRLNPEDAMAHYRLGNLWSDQGNLKEAVMEYKEAIASNPDYSPPRFRLGVAYEDLAQLDKAIEQYQEAIDINPDDALSHNNLGGAL